MPPQAPDNLRIAVDGAELGCVRWRGRPGSPIVIAAHGLTANAWSWAAVARHLDGEIGLVAVDLRGRGASSSAPGPYGMRTHADDLATVIEKLWAGAAVVTGHSMGTHVALMCAERHPDAVARLVLVDGGPPIPMRPSDDPRTVLDDLLGPAIARLGKVWPDRVTYHEMWRSHPAFAGLLTPEVERYLLSELVPCEGGFRSLVSEEAVRADGYELLTDADVRGAFARRSSPVVVIRAEHGLMAVPPPFVSERAMALFPHHDWRTVPGTNHYSVQIGEQGAAVIAAALRQAVDSIT